MNTILDDENVDEDDQEITNDVTQENSLDPMPGSSNQDIKPEREIRNTLLSSPRTSSTPSRSSSRSPSSSPASRSWSRNSSPDSSRSYSPAVVSPHPLPVFKNNSPVSRSPTPLSPIYEKDPETGYSMNSPSYSPRTPSPYYYDTSRITRMVIRDSFEHTQTIEFPTYHPLNTIKEEQEEEEEDKEISPSTSL